MSDAAVLFNAFEDDEEKALEYLETQLLDWLNKWEVSHKPLTKLEDFTDVKKLRWALLIAFGEWQQEVLSRLVGKLRL